MDTFGYLKGENVLKHDDIVNIQNTFWKAYKEARELRSLSKYNKDVDALIGKYIREENSAAYTFCQDLVIAWAPIMNEVVKAGVNV